MPDQETFWLYNWLIKELMAGDDRDKSSRFAKKSPGSDGDDMVALHLRTIEALALAIEGRETTPQH
jgi:hypothetical protein